MVVRFHITFLDLVTVLLCDTILLLGVVMRICLFILVLLLITTKDTYGFGDYPFLIDDPLKLNPDIDSVTIIREMVILHNSGWGERVVTNRTTKTYDRYGRLHYIDNSNQTFSKSFRSLYEWKDSLSFTIKHYRRLNDRLNHLSTSTTVWSQTNSVHLI